MYDIELLFGQGLGRWPFQAMPAVVQQSDGQTPVDAVYPVG